MSARPWRKPSSAAQHPISTASSARVCVIWPSGFWEEFHVSVSEQTLGREVRAIGCRKPSARPMHHAQDAEAVETLKNFPAALAEIAAARQG
ncbi:hypothetical protein GOC31_31760 [Sinorhizobium meliloti]|nr:hypothetical protein [Sinorhizobium meliloti]MDX0253171.1 hypothetical protein [Sinorhizobium meliloti]